MSTFDKESFYYSGQGVVMIGGRDLQGKPAGLVPVANVSALGITIEETVEEHKESQTGARGIDKRISTETNCTLTMTMESFIADNLAIALRAGISKIQAGSVTAQPVNGYLGKVSPLGHIMVSDVTVTAAATPLVMYTNDETAWDYKLNADAGSIMLNYPGGPQALSALATAEGEVLTGISLASQAVLTVVSSAGFVVGGSIIITGVPPGTLANALNNKSHTVTGVTPTSITIGTSTTGLLPAYTSGATAFIEGPIPMTINYSYAAQNRVDALTEGSRERYLRFEGLNTADDLKPVVIEVFKFQTDPLAELALINEGITGFELEGSVLSDSLQQVGSKYFKQTLLR